MTARLYLREIEARQGAGIQHVQVALSSVPRPSKVRIGTAPTIMLEPTARLLYYLCLEID